MDIDGQNDLECSICSDLFHDPRVLPCGHTFCYSCLVKWRTKDPSCPVCRKGCNHPDTLPINYSLKNLVDAFEKKNGLKPKCPCGEIAIKYCSSCPSFLCETHFEQHSQTLFTKNHKTKNSDEIKLTKPKVVEKKKKPSKEKSKSEPRKESSLSSSDSESSNEVINPILDAVQIDESEEDFHENFRTIPESFIEKCNQNKTLLLGAFIGILCLISIIIFFCGIIPISKKPSNPVPLPPKVKKAKYLKTSYRFLRKFQTNASDDNSLRQDEQGGRLIVGHFGNILYIDPSNIRIQVFNSSGGFLKQFGSSYGQFDPRALVIRSDGSILVAAGSIVHVFNSQYSFSAKFGSFNVAMGIAINNEGDIGIADHYNHRVQLFRSDGTFYRQISVQYPRCIIFDSNNNVIVSSYNYIIQVFNPLGSLLRQFGSSGSGNGQLNYPSDFAIDDDDKLVVADLANNRIQIFDSRQGSWVSSFGYSGSGDGSFKFPTSVAIDNDGNILVVDYTKRVQVFG